MGRCMGGIQQGGPVMRFGPGGDNKLMDVKSDPCRPYGYLGWLRDNSEGTKALVQRLLLGDLHEAKTSA
jgi:hypothetical protein